MRTKKEIENKLAWYKEWQAINPIFGAFIYPVNYTVECQKRLLRWVLGEDLLTAYYCTNCNIGHTDIKCPNCGGNTTVNYNEPEIKQS